MSGKKGKEKDGGTLVIKREEGGEHGHHGGAWKVAYADFVTAMMAFFLLMWLLNATTQEQRLGIANYFAPTNVFGAGESGTGRPFGGNSPVDDGSLVGRAGTPTVEQQAQGGPPPQDETTESSGEREARADNAGDKPQPHVTGGHFANPRAVGSGGEDATDRGAADRDGSAAAIAARVAAEEAAAAEGQALDQAAEAIRRAVSDDPGLRELARQVAVDVTPEGLRVQLLDAERQSMFASGGAAPSDRVRALLARIAPTLAAIGNPVTIVGHTDSAPFRSGSGVTNWELSADRANATRRLLVEGGLPEDRVRSVTGVADREPLLPADPRAPANRRIGILIQRAHQAPAPGNGG
ncbi:flagellar motor protein MotB [Elioraea sp.]|uniref:flagellar motor protein MotB n=1 Tax=Elioraea sp. TaxID=2185103 RepID=UPI0025C11DBE|nr:flagellar motor protein MotB [Elioraea sp.]